MRNATLEVPLAKGRALDEQSREKLATLIEEVGETATMRQLEISRHTLARCLAGLPMQRSTVEYVARRLTG